NLFGIFRGTFQTHDPALQHQFPDQRSGTGGTPDRSGGFALGRYAKPKRRAQMRAAEGASSKTPPKCAPRFSELSFAGTSAVDSFTSGRSSVQSHRSGGRELYVTLVDAGSKCRYTASVTSR